MTRSMANPFMVKLTENLHIRHSAKRGGAVALKVT